MSYRIIAARWGVLAVVLASCGAPPEYTLQRSAPVTLNDRSCQADLYTVSYDRLFNLGEPESVVTRDHGTQYRIVCGTTTTTCPLNQGLEACIAMLERPESSDNDDSYRPPT